MILKIINSDACEQNKCSEQNIDNFRLCVPNYRKKKLNAIRTTLYSTVNFLFVTGDNKNM